MSWVLFIFVLAVYGSLIWLRTDGGGLGDNIAVACGIIAAFVLFLLATSLYETRYKQGQVDALTGKVKYELVVHDDSTRTWQEIKE